ncbi:excinuclease ABC subunit UvrA [Pseudobacteriovorax antillogorgiicola]|uniref:UvrABC system protein A n=1 Tax=Pseudobacteriovorax antillogorgiicola TaxID=1513793 RepID=A0A1Y6CPE0_9BACT|nr:excinuclease ABC subunit UvrA [Pseudobacteriovorax antillogorgiicola]TCS44381.1 excinuclease ABC subunit A [Pseudobacteriovorax antillogorgiicola]SMF79403.1 excinuclease ABC subunit A [Pseudobacteriovorax antillogorgiicola]
MNREQSIWLKGVSTNNLKDIDAFFPLGAYTVVTGKSGSGKSSLVFDTLYGEAYRRYVESLSSFARQYLKTLPKPKVLDVGNIPAAIAVKQSKAGQNNRSTVGTMTELDDLVRIILTQAAEIHCCGTIVKKETGKSVTEQLYQSHEGAKILVMASMSHWAKLKAAELKAQLAGQGFTRALVDGGVVRIEDTPAKALKTGYVVIDRLSLNEKNFHRCLESASLGLRLGRGEVVIHIGEGELKTFSSHLQCETCGTSYFEPSLSLFNFNNPLGACESCQGFGRVPVLDHHKIIPNESESLDTEGVSAWNFGQHKSYYRIATQSAKARGLNPKTQFCEYSEEDWEWLYNGDERGSFKGIQGYFAWLDSKKYKAHYRIHSARFHTYDTCDECDGTRFKPIVSHYLVNGQSIIDLSRMTLNDLQQWFSEFRSLDGDQDATAQLSMGLQEALAEAQMRLAYLNKIGVHYLHLARSSKSLSGGEVQRINMARSLGSHLTDTLFCLDEPSSGLHPRDSQNLLEVIKSLRDQGNTVVVVEHEKGVIDGADHLIEVGPEAGHRGGELIYQGSPKSLPSATEIDWEYMGGDTPHTFLSLSGAAIHNLKDVAARIPVKALTAVCGVSGSGKTSLIRHTLYPLLCRIIGKEVELDRELKGAKVKPERLVRDFSDVHLMSQEPIGRSTRSNIATYLGILTEVRKLFSETPLAKAQNLKPGYFSFNVPGGRCEECKGLGTVEEDLSFLGAMNVTCPSCRGLRFQESVLDIKYRDKSLLDVLAMTVAEARVFFFDIPKLTRIFDMTSAVGMDYVTLGQHTSSFSGGEAQRLKILSFLIENKDQKPRIFIFDEPTTGLSDRDVQMLLQQFRILVGKGHTVVVVEHHLGVIKSADWVLELGPEAASEGGQIVFEGTPKDLQQESTITSGYLN